MHGGNRTREPLIYSRGSYPSTTGTSFFLWNFLVIPVLMCYNVNLGRILPSYVKTAVKKYAILSRYCLLFNWSVIQLKMTRVELVEIAQWSIPRCEWIFFQCLSVLNFSSRVVNIIFDDFVLVFANKLLH